MKILMVITKSRGAVLYTSLADADAAFEDCRRTNTPATMVDADEDDCTIVRFDGNESHYYEYEKANTDPRPTGE